MSAQLKEWLLAAATERQTKMDPAHDIEHVKRVMTLAERIAESVGADKEVVLAAAAFHDIVVYPKNTPRSAHETDESAELAGALLRTCDGFPPEKIGSVQTAIRQCSFKKGIMPELLEARVLQDADRLEATGAISIMRTFTSGGQMNRPFYDLEDPLRDREVPQTSRSSVDFFYRRLLRVEAGMHTEYARQIAKRRTEFLRTFLDELRLELQESGVIS